MKLMKETTIQLSALEKSVIRELDDTLVDFCQNDFPTCTNCPFKNKESSYCIKGLFLTALDSITNYKA